MQTNARKLYVRGFYTGFPENCAHFLVQITVTPVSTILRRINVEYSSLASLTSIKTSQSAHLSTPHSFFTKHILFQSIQKRKDFEFNRLFECN